MNPNPRNEQNAPSPYASVSGGGHSAIGSQTRTAPLRTSIDLLAHQLEEAQQIASSFDLILNLTIGDSTTPSISEPPTRVVPPGDVALLYRLEVITENFAVTLRRLAVNQNLLASHFGLDIPTR